MGGGGAASAQTAVTNAINVNQQQQAELPFLMNLPGYAGMRQQQSQNILSQLQGDVPTDVIQQILTRAAERGISTGTPGAPNANSAYLRALGLTSLDLMKTGSEGLSAAIEQTPRSELVNPWSLYVPQTLAIQEEQAAQRGQSNTPWGYAPGSVVGQAWLDRYKPTSTTTYTPHWGFP